MKINKKIIWTLILFVLVVLSLIYFIGFFDKKISGCMDPMSLNYNPEATNSDGSCVERIYGCTNSNYIEYDVHANTNENHCLTPKIRGCTDELALNYRKEVNYDNGSCKKTKQKPCWIDRPNFVQNAYKDELNFKLPDSEMVINYYDAGFCKGFMDWTGEYNTFGTDPIFYLGDCYNPNGKLIGRAGNFNQKPFSGCVLEEKKEEETPLSMLNQEWSKEWMSLATLDMNNFWGFYTPYYELLWEVWWESDLVKSIPKWDNKVIGQALNYFNNGRRVKKIILFDNGYIASYEYAEKDWGEDYYDHLRTVKKNLTIYSPDLKLIYYERYDIPDSKNIESLLQRNQGLSSLKPNIIEKTFFHKNGNVFLNVLFDEDNPYQVISMQVFDHTDKNNTVFNFMISDDLSIIGECVNDDINMGFSSAKLLLDDLKNKNNIDYYTLDEFINHFIDDCKRNNINFPKQHKEIVFKKLNENTLATANAKNNNDSILIYVDPIEWEKASIEKKWYIVYHELGHDLLNLDHGQGGKMMFCYAEHDYNWVDFYWDKQNMFNYVKERADRLCTEEYKVGNGEDFEYFDISTDNLSKFLKEYPDAKYVSSGYPENCYYWVYK
tara:strand:- start:3372 stop:5192 length:1821 start_codon:yes stop_codon:yes gene_type:complete